MGIEDAERRQHALAYFRETFRHQMKGELDEAVVLERRSIESCPTGEAHTSLGWTYSFRGEYDAAIAECLRAIEIDPEFGNPYNDAGAYLIDKGRLAEMVLWLEKAAQPHGYATPCFAHYKLGRVWEMRNDYQRAVSLPTSIEVQPTIFARHGCDSTPVRPVQLRRSPHAVA